MCEKIGNTNTTHCFCFWFRLGSTRAILDIFTIGCDWLSGQLHHTYLGFFAPLYTPVIYRTEYEESRFVLGSSQLMFPKTNWRVGAKNSERKQTRNADTQGNKLSTFAIVGYMHLFTVHMHLSRARRISVHLARSYTKPPAQKGAFHMSPIQKKAAIFDTLKMDGWTDGEP